VELILKCLGGEAPRPYSLAPVAVGEAHVPFTGRTLELQRLDVAFERARAGALRTVHVSGTSGIGKTRLVREFLAKVRASGEALVFTSRCHPHETVAFNAIDGLVDEVSALLERSTSVRPTLSPARANALSCLFPGLERALGVSANDASELFADEVDVRLRAFRRSASSSKGSPAIGPSCSGSTTCSGATRTAACSCASCAAPPRARCSSSFRTAPRIGARAR